MPQNTTQFARQLSRTLYEYLVITTPIAIYVCLEAKHKDDVGFFLRSPEWSIATIFLSFTSINSYLQDIFSKHKGALDKGILNVYALANIMIVLFATLNAYWSMEHDSAMLLIIRGCLFIAATGIFFVFMTKPGND